MKQMTIISLFAFAALAAPALAEEQATSGDHIVTEGLAEARLAGASAERADNLAAVETFLTSPMGSGALSQVGLDVAQGRSAAAVLSDAELAELAQRLTALQADPVAGQFEGRGWLWWAVVAAGAVVLLILIT